MCIPSCTFLSACRISLTELFYCSCVLFGMYVLFKFYKDLANLLLGLYFTGLGVLALAGLLAPFFQPFVPRQSVSHSHP
jgi:hypothetical protein